MTVHVTAAPLVGASLLAFQDGGITSEPGTLIVQIVIFLTTLAGFGYQILMRRMDAKKEERNRQWDLEDRARARDELARNVTRQAIAVSREQQVIASDIKQMIAENTEVSVKALNEANDVNTRIADLTKKFYESEDGRHGGS
jgi:hypothetical protein